MGVRASFGPPATAVPGETARCALTVENTGPGPEDVRVELLGDLAAWGWANPSSLVVAPGATGTLAVTVKLPRAPQPPPGPLALSAAVVSAADRVVVEGVLEVAPFVDAIASLRPHTSSGRSGRHRLSIENRGNAPLAARVEARGDDVAVRVQPEQLDLGPGGSAEADVTVRTARRGLGPRGVNRPFEIVVRGEGLAAPAATEGVLEVPAGGWVARVTIALLVLAVAAVALRATVGSGSGSSDGGGPSASKVAATADSTCPGRDHLSPDANGIVRPGVKPLFDYSFLFVGADGCQPARFNPCEPVRYLLNRSLATDADVADLDAAIRKISDATGLQFQFVGTSTEDPRSTARPVRGADGALTWPPVLIGWAHLGTGDSLRPSTTGAAGSPPPTSLGVVGGGGRPQVSGNVITTGNLILNLDAVTDTDTHNPVPHGFGSGVNWGRIMMHELAHVVGLGHVESRTSIMNETLTQQTIPSTEFGVGDLIGLRDLGKQGGCLPVPPLVTPGPPRS